MSLDFMCFLLRCNRWLHHERFVKFVRNEMLGWHHLVNRSLHRSSVICHLNKNHLVKSLIFAKIYAKSATICNMSLFWFICCHDAFLSSVADLCTNWREKRNVCQLLYKILNFKHLCCDNNYTLYFKFGTVHLLL